MNKNSFAVATLLVAGMASMVFADDPKKKTDVKDGPKTVAKADKTSPGVLRSQVMSAGG